jgi:hypothetical protein
LSSLQQAPACADQASPVKVPEQSRQAKPSRGELPSGRHAELEQLYFDSHANRVIELMQRIQQAQFGWSAVAGLGRTKPDLGSSLAASLCRQRTSRATPPKLHIRNVACGTNNFMQKQKSCFGNYNNRKQCN